MNNYPHSDLTNGGEGKFRASFPSGAPEEYIRNIYDSLQHDFALGLYDAIQCCKHPVVVEIFEVETKEIEPLPYGNWMTHDPRTSVITFSFRLTPVERRHYVVNVLDGYDSSSVRWSNEKHSIIHINFHKYLDKFLSHFGVK